MGRLFSHGWGKVIRQREAERRLAQTETGWTGVNMGEILGPNIGYDGKIGLE